MTQLSVNLNKVALLRKSRGRNFPDPLKVASDVLRFGANGITLHPRPDERHARRSDVASMRELVKNSQNELHRPIEMNVEGYPDPEWLSLVFATKPHQATLVPDAPNAITSNAGWDFVHHQALLSDLCQRFRDENIRSSLFLEVDRMSEDQWEALKKIRPDRVELYTEAYAEAFAEGTPDRVLSNYRACADRANQLGIEVNAGHDLNLNNLPLLLREIPAIKEVSIGHALIVEALYFGFEKTINDYMGICTGRVAVGSTP